jgi:hypothetical protein
MIDPAEFLLSLAEIAVALAGFSGLIVAIRATGPSGWHPRDIWSLSWMMGASVGTMFLALLPLWLAGLDFAPADAYRASAVVASVYCSVFLVLMTLIGRVLSLRGYRRRIPFFPTAMVTLLGLALAAAGTTAAGLVPASRLHGVYTGGLIALLLISSLALALFLTLLARVVKKRGGERGVTMALSDGPDPADEQATRGG